jgi:hypothetical protein
MKEKIEEKKPRLFYWEDAVDAWIPFEQFSPETTCENMGAGDKTNLRLQRFDMTDNEYDNLPEG